MNIKKSLVVYSLIISSLLSAQNSNAIKDVIDSYSKTELFKNASWSVTARYLESGKEIIAYNSELALAPASNMKLLTTSAALDILGEDYTFETKVYYDGSINSSGELIGNIYIVGGGDPTLGNSSVKGSLPLDELMNEWTDKIKNAGIKSVKGNIIADDFLYDRIPVPDNWYWIDLGNYYAATTSALTINNNLYYLYFKPSKKVGDIATVLRTEPEIEGLKFTNYMQTGKRGSGDNGYIFCAPLQFNATLRGTIPQGKSEFSIKGSIPNPPLFAAQYLKKQLGLKGISVTGSAKVLEKEINYKDKTLILKTVSPPLRDIVFIINKKSDNLYTEMLLRAVGLKAKGEGSVEKGIEAVEDYFKSKNIEIGGLLMFDGCGLSRSDAITTKLMTDLLASITKEKYFDAFYNSLGIVGDRKDISHFRNMGIGTPLEKNAHIKSGVIEGVRAYSGYLKDLSGRTIIFSMIANNYNGEGSAVTNIHKKIMIELAKLNSEIK